MISPQKRYSVIANDIRGSEVYRIASYEQKSRIDQRLFNPETINHLRRGECDVELDLLLAETAIGLLSKGKFDRDIPKTLSFYKI